MKNQSLRWRLPFSYAGIALLATFSLGLILLLTLRAFYTNQEKNYIESVAQEISSKITPFFTTMFKILSPGGKSGNNRASDSIIYRFFSHRV